MRGGRQHEATDHLVLSIEKRRTDRHDAGVKLAVGQGVTGFAYRAQRSAKTLPIDAQRCAFYRLALLVEEAFELVGRQPREYRFGRCAGKEWSSLASVEQVVEAFAVELALYAHH